MTKLSFLLQAFSYFGWGRYDSYLQTWLHFNILTPGLQPLSATCGAGLWPERALWYSTHEIQKEAYITTCLNLTVLIPSNQTRNKHFVCSLSGSQLMWQIYLYLLGPTWKIRYQNFNSIVWVLSICAVTAK